MIPSVGLGWVSHLLCRVRLTHRKSFSCYHCEENLQVVGEGKPVESEISLDEWVGFFSVCLNFQGGFLVVFFSSLGPSLSSRNLTLNRATGITDGGRGGDVQRVGATLDGSLEGSGNLRIFCGLL